MPSVDVVIDLSPDECEMHYAGHYRRIRVSSVDGRSVILPAAALRRLVLADGIHGIFRLNYDHNGRFSSMQVLERWVADG